MYSVPDSRRASASGYPDLTLAKRTARNPVIVAELKRVGQKPRADQQAWLWCFAAAGIPAYTWTPADWPEIESVLGSTADTPHASPVKLSHQQPQQTAADGDR